MLILVEYFWQYMNGIDGDKELIKAETFQPWTPLRMKLTMASRLPRHLNDNVFWFLLIVGFLSWFNSRYIDLGRDLTQEKWRLDRVPQLVLKDLASSLVSSRWLQALLLFIDFNSRESSCFFLQIFDVRRKIQFLFLCYTFQTTSFG